MKTSKEIQQRFEKEKKAYWHLRNDLLKKYKGKWVAIVNEQVVAIGDEMGKVIEDAFQKTQNKVMFVGEVGLEDRISRIRQLSTGFYNYEYSPPAPFIKVPVTDIIQTITISIDFMVDTGADLTIFRSDDAIKLNLYDTPVGFRYVAGIGSKPEERQLYVANVNAAGQEVTVAVDCRDDVDENLLGRDVTNKFELTVCARHELVQLKRISA